MIISKLFALTKDSPAQFKGAGRQLGVTAIEYVMIAAIVAAVILAAFQLGLTDAFDSAFERISDFIDEAGTD